MGSAKGAGTVAEGDGQSHGDIFVIVGVFFSELGLGGGQVVVEEDFAVEAFILDEPFGGDPGTGAVLQAVLRTAEVLAEDGGVELQRLQGLCGLFVGDILFKSGGEFLDEARGRCQDHWGEFGRGKN